MMRWRKALYGPRPLDAIDLPAGCTPAQLVRAVLAADRRLVAQGAVAGVAWAGALALVPPVVGLVIDRGVIAGDTAALVRWLLLLGAVGALVCITDAIRHYHASRLFTTGHMRIARTVTERVVANPGIDEVRAPGDITSAIQNDGERIGWLCDLCCRGTGAIVVFAVVAVGVVATSWQIGLVIVIGTPVALIAAAPLWRPLERRSHRSMQVLGEAAAGTGDALAGLRVAAGIGAGPTLVARNAETSARVRDAGIAVARIESGWRAIEVGLPGLFVAGVVWLGGRLAIDGQITPGQLVAFLGLATFIAIPVSTFVELGSVLSEALAAARRVLDVINDVNPPPRAAIGSVDVRSGTITGIVAPSRVFDDLRQARIALTVDGAVATTLTSTSDPFLFAGTVRSNIVFDDTGFVDPEVLATTTVDEIVSSFPDGLDEDVSETGRSLSGGQRQRVGLARALHTRTSTLVLVEPTNAVDAATDDVIAARLRRTRAGLTTVIATVSPSLINECDEVVILDEHGSIVRRGSPEHVADDSSLRLLVFGDDARGVDR
jgi:ABC-type bacteriocin/lantibiotic exporter with double-glycine peptidase domain